MLTNPTWVDLHWWQGWNSPRRGRSIIGNRDIINVTGRRGGVVVVVGISGPVGQRRHSEPNATDIVHFLLGQWVMHRSRNGFSSIHNRLRYTFHHTFHFGIQLSSSQSRSRMRQPSFTSEWRTVTKLTPQSFKDGFDSHWRSSLVLPVKASPVLLLKSSDVWRHNPSYFSFVGFLFLVFC